MTNKEYYKKMGVSFADALKEYDDKKYSTVEKWLLAERKPNKFKIGDICFNKFSTSVSVITNVYTNYFGENYYHGFKIKNVDNGEVKWCVFDMYCDDYDPIHTKIGTADKDFMELPNL